MDEVRRRVAHELAGKPTEHVGDFIADRDNHGGGIANDFDGHTVKLGRRNTHHGLIIAQFDRASPATFESTYLLVVISHPSPSPRRFSNYIVSVEKTYYG
jgi:hypothetical protein